MTKEPKIWISLMVYNQVNHIKELCENLDWCDGIVAVDHYSDDGTYEILEANKKNGRIIRMPWINMHCLSKTSTLQCGTIRPGDWVYTLDAQERVNKEFVGDIKNHIKNWESQGIGCIFWGKPLIFKFHPEMTYVGNPHVFPTPIWGKTLNVQDESTVTRDGNTIHMGKYLTGKKDLDNTVIFHGAKYYFYPISNQVDMFYAEYGQEAVSFHHKIRRQFLMILEDILKEPPTIFNFLDYIKKVINKEVEINSFILNYIDFEFCLTDAIRLKILNQHRDKILENRFNWSFKIYLDTKDLEQKDTGYQGTITKYKNSK